VDHELAARHAGARTAMEAHGLDAVLVVGNEYTGFDGAVQYYSGFRIVHRYAYVLLPLDDDPLLVFPSEARYVGEHGAAGIEAQVFADHPGEWLAQHLRGRRVGVHGLDYVMPVRDHVELARRVTLVPFDVELDLVRAVKTPSELDSVRQSIRLAEEAFELVLHELCPGASEAALLAPAERLFTERGCGRRTMNMILGGEPGPAAVEFRLASPERTVRAGELLLPSLEIAGPGGHWVEVSRPLCAGDPDPVAMHMLAVYSTYFSVTERVLRAGATAHDVHRAVAACFDDVGYRLGHVTGHSIGMTMIEHPRICEGETTELREGMVISMHPHVMTSDGDRCFFMQDTWLVRSRRGERLSTLPVKIFAGAS
jgi:Xaa-Pro dipeptidase